MDNKLIGFIFYITFILVSPQLFSQNPEPLIKGITTPQYFAVLVKDVDGAVGWYCSVFGLKKWEEARQKTARGGLRILKTKNFLWR